MVDFSPEAMYERRLDWISKHKKELEDPKMKLSALYGLEVEYFKVAFLDWHLHQSPEKFQEYMKASVRCQEERFHDARKRGLNDRTNMVMVGSVSIAIASGDQKFFVDYLTFFDDHFDYEEKPMAFLGDWAYRCWVCLILGRNLDQFDFFLEKLQKVCDKKEYRKFKHYPQVLKSIWLGDEQGFHENLKILTDDYKGRFMKDDVNRFLSVWGISICHIAKFKGMTVDFDHPYVPKELIALS
jgi:hypothetical protein